MKKFNKKSFLISILAVFGIVLIGIWFISNDSVDSINQAASPTPAAPSVPITPAATSAPTPAATVEPDPSPSPEPVKPEVNLVRYDGPIEHIFFHPLIVYPELAFDGDRMAQGYDDWFVTIREFKSIIQSLYDNDYILVDLQSLYEETTDEQGATALKLAELMLPEGKKPLVLSIDDLNYYEYMIKNGNASKLVLDEEGNVVTQSVTPEGEVVVRRDDEIVPILDVFVEEHPDFSFEGAKGILALTGYEGVLGYRTRPDHPDYEAEKAAALEVVERLKETGWSFASHSWGHPDAAAADYERMQRDTERWRQEVEPIVGTTPVYIYPYGSRLKHDDPKFRLLTDAGFNFFCGVGPVPYIRNHTQVIEMDRRNIDGYSMRNQVERLAPLFDAEATLDPIRPSGVNG